MIDNLQKTPVKFGERIALDELVHGEVFDAMSQEAGLASDRAGQEGFSATCPAVHQDVLCPVDEAAIGQLDRRAEIQRLEFNPSVNKLSIANICLAVPQVPASVYKALYEYMMEIS